MAGVDTLGCLAAIVSAFHGAVDLAEAVRAQSDRQRRIHGVAQDAEQAFEEKMLLRSFMAGETQVKSARDEKYRRYGDAFRAGDAVVLSALKDVMISLQMDVIAALQVASSLKNAQLDIPRLHEYSIMNKNSALRAIDDLCKRLPEAQSDTDSTMDSLLRQSAPSGGQVRMTGVDRPLALFLPSHPLTPPSSPPQPAAPKRTSPVRKSSKKASVSSTEKRKGLSRMFSGFGASLMSANDDYGAFRSEANLVRRRTLEQAQQERQSPELDKMGRRSLHDSAFGGSPTSSRHRPTPSITSTVFSDGQSFDTAESSDPPEYRSPNNGTPRNDSDTLPSTAVSSDPNNSDQHNENKKHDLSHSHSSSTSSSATRHSSKPITQWDDDDGIMRATLAPEVVTPGYESMLPSHPGRPPPRTAPQPPPDPYSLKNVHPAFRDQYMMSTPVISNPVPENIWAPLARPEKTNAYHNFCKGAWQIRERLEEGLGITMLADPKTGAVAPVWKCKQCAFRSKSMPMPTSASIASQSLLPDHIYYLQSGIRYRWLFLAKSHIHADSPRTKQEDYDYGCIFCAAEGRETACYAGLERLVEHVLTKHKTVMMTPEVRRKTGCVVGRVAERGDGYWDVNLPETQRRKFSENLGQYVVKAVTGLS